MVSVSPRSKSLEVRGLDGQCDATNQLAASIVNTAHSALTQVQVRAMI